MALLVMLVINILGLCDILGIVPVCVVNLVCVGLMLICQNILKMLDE